jgi:hypothetical protein
MRHTSMCAVMLTAITAGIAPAGDGRNSRISLDSLRVAPDFLIRRARPI